MNGLFAGNSVNKIGVGAWQMGMRGWGGDYGERDSIEALQYAVENGINFIDTAEIYGGGRSEALIGKALEGIERKRYFIATKLAGFNASARRVRKSVKNSMKRLGVDYVDLYQVHWEPSAYTSMTNLFEELEVVAKEGFINHIGVSNFSADSIEKANDSMKEFKVESNQIKFNLVQRPHVKLLGYMERNRIKLIAWSPLGQGFLTGKYSKSNPPGGSVRKVNSLFARSNFLRFEPLLSELKSIAESRGASMTEIVLAYEKHINVLPIPGFKSTKQVSQIINALSLNLSEEEKKSVEEKINDCGVMATSTRFYPSYVPNFLARIGVLFT